MPFPCPISVKTEHTEAQGKGWGVWDELLEVTPRCQPIDGRAKIRTLSTALLPRAARLEKFRLTRMPGALRMS